MICCNGLNAQDVFSPSDTLTDYDDQAVPGSINNPALPPDAVMAKWVRTNRVAWNTTNFKCYIWNGMAFRLRFPNNYNPANAAKYPVLVFFHGGGETGSVYDNENQLVWGAEVFQQRIKNGQWNGFMVFPQQTAIGWDDSYFTRINAVLDTLQKYNHTDPDRTIAMGLSAGGFGAVSYTASYPKRVATAIASSPIAVNTLNSNVSNFLQVPLWVANGGEDLNPPPFTVQDFYSSFRNAGGNIYQTYFVNNDHNTWTDMWNQANASGSLLTTTYWNNAHKAQPLLYFQPQQFCSGVPIAARMAITAGYYQYEWQQNGASIAGANANEYTATQAGQYRVRFMREQGGAWSDWSPSPVIISTKTCAADTLFAEHFTNDNSFATAAAYTQNNFTCQNGIRIPGANNFSQDASGVQGSRFLINFTKAGTGCVFAAGDKVWNSPSALTVTPNTNYEFSFYLANQTATGLAQIMPVINGVPVTATPAQATGIGSSNWNKFTYTWNSGNAGTADLSLTNGTAVSTGNDFAIDEISFKLAAVAPVPGCTQNLLPANASRISTSTSALLKWRSAANATTYDVYVWTGATPPTTAFATVTDTSFTATSLIADTKYNWYVVPKNKEGVRAGGCANNQTSFTTAITVVLPSCTNNELPVNGAVLTAASVATLKWTATSGATSYDVYLWTGNTPSLAPTATTASLSYAAINLVGGSLYNWYIVPKNSAGQAVGCSARTSVFTTATASAYPDCVSNLSPADNAIITTTTTASLTWNAANAATGYDVYLWKGATAPTQPVATVSSNAYNAAGLTASSLYHWYVVPRNAAGAASNCSVNASAFNTAAPPASPGCVINKLPVSGTVVTGTSTAQLSWTAAATAISYDVYLWKGTLPPAVPVATVAGTAFAATGLTPGTTYYWYTVPRNTAGLATGCISNKTSFTTTALPSAPICATNLSPANGSTVSTTNTATLSWTAVTDAVTYDVYVWKGNVPPIFPTASTSANLFAVTGLTEGITYNWYVVPKNRIGAAGGCNSKQTSFNTAAQVTRGNGVGLLGDYYNADNFKGLLYLSRIDPTINFSWEWARLTGYRQW